MHEPLIVGIVLSCSFVDNNHRPWAMEGTPPFEALGEYLQQGLRFWKQGEPKKLLNLEGKVQMLGETKEEWLGLFCSNFLVQQEIFPPCKNVWC